MVWLCARNRDFSPLLPLSWKDFIYLEVFSLEFEKIEKDKRLVFEDVCFYLSRLSDQFTGTKGLNFLPSKVVEMGRKWEERNKMTKLQ